MDWSKSFDPVTLAAVVSGDQASQGMMIQGVSVLFLFLISIFPYVAIFRLVIITKNSYHKWFFLKFWITCDIFRNITRELRLSIIPLGQSLCFIFVCFIYTALYVSNITNHVSHLKKLLKVALVLLQNFSDRWRPNSSLFSPRKRSPFILEPVGVYNPQQWHSKWIQASYIQNTRNSLLVPFDLIKLL